MASKRKRKLPEVITNKRRAEVRAEVLRELLKDVSTAPDLGLMRDWRPGIVRELKRLRTLMDAMNGQATADTPISRVMNGTNAKDGPIFCPPHEVLKRYDEIHDECKAEHFCDDILGARMNRLRAMWGELVLRYFAQLTGLNVAPDADGFATALGDLLGDLRHFCGQYEAEHLDMDERQDRGERYVREEMETARTVEAEAGEQGGGNGQEKS